MTEELYERGKKLFRIKRFKNQRNDKRKRRKTL